MATKEAEFNATVAMDRRLNEGPARFRDLHVVASKWLSTDSYRFADRYLQRRKKKGEIAHKKHIWSLTSSHPLSPMAGEPFPQPIQTGE